MHFNKYDRFGSAYHWKWWAVQGHYRQWTSYVLDQMPEEGDGATVLDFGSGDGVPAAQLVKRGYVVTGVEPHDAARMTARERVPEAEFLPEYDGETSYDYVFCLETIEHMEDPQPLVDAVLNCKEYAIVTSPVKDELPNAHALTTLDIKKLFKGCYVKTMYTDDIDQCWRITPRGKS